MRPHQGMNVMPGAPGIMPGMRTSAPIFMHQPVAGKPQVAPQKQLVKQNRSPPPVVPMPPTEYKMPVPQPGHMRAGAPPKNVVVVSPVAANHEPASAAGVGLYFKMDSSGRYYVEMVMPNSSAERTGVVAKGDILEVVDQQPTTGVSLPQLRDMILGPVGSYVKLNFLREKGGESFRYDIDLMRGDALRNSPGEQDAVVQKKSPKIQRAALPPPAPDKEPEQARMIHSDFASITENDVDFKSKYLAEQRMHQEAEREAKLQKAQISSLQKMVAQLQSRVATDTSNTTFDETKALQSGFVRKIDFDNAMQRVHQLEKELVAVKASQVLPQQAGGDTTLDAVRALQGGYVPKEDLMSAMQRSQHLEKELAECRLAVYEEMSANMVPRHDFLELERRANGLEQQLLGRKQGLGSDDQIMRMCVMALPAAVSALHSLSEDTGHASSATWALVRAEDYVAHMASLRFPLSIPGLVTRIQPDSESFDTHYSSTVVDVQDACLAMSVISWDPEGRNMLLRDPRTVPALVQILRKGCLTPETVETSEGDSASKAVSALNVAPNVLCARFAAIALGNFSLDEGGRQSIVCEIGAIKVLIDSLSYEDLDTASFSLLCAGNLFMIPEARQEVVEMNGAVDMIFAKLSSSEAMTVRNFASDDKCREAVTKVKGSVALLQELSRSPNPRIRDHAEHALFNLRMVRSREIGARNGAKTPPESTLLTPAEPESARTTNSVRPSNEDNRSAFESIGSNLFGMA